MRARITYLLELVLCYKDYVFLAVKTALTIKMKVAGAGSIGSVKFNVVEARGVIPTPQSSQGGVS